MARTTAALILAALCAGCGDPLIVIGDVPGNMRVVAGTGSNGIDVNSDATRSELFHPLALAADADGTLYVADQGATVTQLGISRDAARIFAVAPDGTLRVILDDGGCAPICVFEPADMDRRGDELIVADAVGNRVVAVDIESGAVRSVAGSGAPGNTPDGAAAATAALRAIRGVAVGDDGTIYFSEAGNHKIRAIDGNGALRTVAGSGIPGHSGSGGDALSARLSEPAGIAYSSGSLYITEPLNDIVRRIDLASGTIANVAGNGVRGLAGDGGAATEARVNAPIDVAVTADGATLFIADPGNFRVRAVNLASGLISTFAGTGAASYLGGGRPAGQTPLAQPSAVLATAQRSHLFLADEGNGVVYRTTLRF